MDRQTGKGVITTAVIASLIALVLIMGPTVGNLAYAAKASGGSSGGGGSSDSGGSSKGGTSSGGDSGKGSDSGGSKGGDSKGSTGGGSIGKNGDDLNDDDHGPPSAPGNDLPGNNQGRTPNPHDDGFTNMDGPQPKHPIFPGESGRDFCKRIHTCTPIFPHFPDRHHHDHDHVDVIQKTVVVHDHNNNEQTIIVNANNQGTCFVTQTQIANSNDILPTLLNQCVSITIIQG